MLLPLLLAVAVGQIPRPEPSHPEWGPAPPVAPYGEAALPADWVDVPMVFPLIGPNHYQNSYGEERGGFKHTGIDIGASKMTPIVAPFSGIIGLKRESFWIYGDNGYAMLGTHLNDDDFGRSDHHADRDMMFAPGLTPGQRVVHGQFIGYVGMSGRATAPHLHFEIYAPGTGRIQGRLRNALPSLQHARVLSKPKAIPAAPDLKPGAGEEKLEGCIRRIEPESMSLTLILLHRQTAGGEPSVVTYPTWRKVRFTPAQLEEVGGWSGLRARGRNEVIPFMVKAGGESVSTLTRVALGGMRPASTR